MKVVAPAPWFVLAALLFDSTGEAQTLSPRSGEFAVVAPGPCQTPADREATRRIIAASIRELTREGRLPEAITGAPVTFSWPLRAAGFLLDHGYHGVSNFVDQNFAAPGQLLDYDCGSRTYDLSSGYNHSGTDMFTWPFGWSKMDNDQVEVVAAAPGTILFKSDGNYDRSCGFGGGNWNAVYVRHADNSVAWYGHLKNGSLTFKNVGEAVAEGEYLGVVGSSGNSTGPHLHFEVHDGTGNLIDPYEGPCNSLSPVSWWATQRPYYDSAINAVLTHDADPEFPPCPQTEIPHTRVVFQPGETVYFAAYYRDQLQGQVSQYSVIDPDGVPQWSWSHSSPATHYAASYWYWYVTLPSNARNGVWDFKVVYLGNTYIWPFIVGMAADAQDLAAAGNLPQLVAVSPNPGRGRFSLSYRLPQAGPVRLGIYDARGRRVATLLDGNSAAGLHASRWDGADHTGRHVRSGIYFARLESGGAVRVKKVVVAQ